VPPRLSGSLLHAFLTNLTTHFRGIDEGFLRDKVAQRAFGQHASAKARLSKCCSPNTDRHLTVGTLHIILDATHEVLVQHLKAQQYPDPEQSALGMQRQACQLIGIPDRDRPRPLDFSMEARFDSARTPEEFGLPNIMAWTDGTFGFAENLKQVQSRSVEVMRYVSERLQRTHNRESQLELLSIMPSIAAINHPGTRWHETMVSHTIAAAERCNLASLAFAKGVNTDSRLRALKLMVSIRSLTFMPTIDSPANVVLALLNGQALPTQTWCHFLPDLKETMRAAKVIKSADPRSEPFHHIEASYFAQSARLLAATGAADDLREADVMYNRAREYFNLKSYPYILLYPIQRQIVTLNWKQALQECVRAVAMLEEHDNQEAATAYAALSLQIARRADPNALLDSRLKQLARIAAGNVSTGYQYSHVFDAKAVRAILGPGRPLGRETRHRRGTLPFPVRPR
jgi:hypothetical protein